MSLNHDEMNDIRELYELGHTPAALAVAYHVSTRRMYQIVQEAPATDEEIAAARVAAAELARARDRREALLEEVWGDAPRGLFASPPT